MTENPDNREDELLGAYLDGELPEEQASVLAERLKRDPRLRSRLEAMRGADDATRELFASLDEVPIPANVLGLFHAGGRQATADVVPLPQRIVQRFTTMPVAIAASVALLAGFLVRDVLRETPEPAGRFDLYEARVVDRDSGLHDLLEHGISAEDRVLSDAASARVLLTFEDGSGEFCRQLEITAGDSSGQGVACRRGRSWQMEAFAFTGPRSAGGPYRTASGETPKAIESTIDALIGRGDPLGSDEEKRIISGGWKKSGQ